MEAIEKISVSIEANAAGGGVSILKNQVKIDFLTEDNGLHKAEDSLGQISNLLERNNIKKEEIKFIYVSIRAGSKTGGKIKLALANGLGRALNLPVIKVITETD
jgi:tRNA A37 threonylcarbamoyladenosine modification protein TsaB